MHSSSRIRLTRQFRFEMAHALSGHDGPCKFIHGHSYKLSITVMGTPSTVNGASSEGMVMDFSDIKKIVEGNVVHVFDHALVLNESDMDHIQITKNHERVIYFPFPPTCELLLQEFHRRIVKHFPAEVKLISMRLDETATSFAEWFASDNH